MTASTNITTAPKPDTGGVESCLNLASLLEKKRRLVAVVESLPAQIEAARDATTGIQQEISAAEMAAISGTDELSASALQKHDAALAGLQKREVESELRERRQRARLVLLEKQVAALDDEIETEAGVVKIEASLAGTTMLATLAQEVETAVAGLRVIYAKVSALTRIVRNPHATDFLQSAFVPDPELSQRFISPLGESYDAAPNLLVQLNDATDAARAEISAQLQPVKEALAMAASHQRYVPLDKRPKPYVVKGELVYETGPRRLPLSQTVVR